jgi:hypothetical protein
MLIRVSWFDAGVRNTAKALQVCNIGRTRTVVPEHKTKASDSFIAGTAFLLHSLRDFLWSLKKKMIV